MKCFSLEQLMEVYGLEALGFEQYLFNVARHFSKDYDGGMWESVIVKGEVGFYLLLDDNQTYHVESSYVESMVMDSKTYSMAIFAYAVNTYGWHIYGKNSSSKFAQELFGLYHFTMRNAITILNKKQLKQFRDFLD